MIARRGAETGEREVRGAEEGVQGSKGYDGGRNDFKSWGEIEGRAIKFLK